MMCSRVIRAPSGLWPVALLLAALSGCGGDPMPPQSPGSVNVTVTTAGAGVDADGYTVALGSRTTPIAASGSATIEGLSPGSYEVTLSGVAANCAVLGDATQAVALAEGQAASVVFEVECLFDAAGVALPITTCSALSPGSVEGVPLDIIPIGGVPSTFERPVLARMSWPGGRKVSLALIDDEASGTTMWIPLHPNGSLDGGDVTVRISDETQSCPPFTFRILPLPAAPDELGDLVDIAQALLDEQASLFGTTREELLGVPASQLEPALLPLAIAQSLVDASSNDGSLRAFSDGVVPDFGPADLDFVERLLARTGLRADLEEALSAIRGLEPAPVGTSSPGGPALALSPGIAFDCITTDDMSAELLSQCMTLARDKAVTARTEAIQNRAIFALDMAALVSRKIAAPISSLISFSQLYDAGLAGNLPSSFVDITLSLDPADFQEDQPGPGDWSPAMVNAISTGWDLKPLLAGAIIGKIAPDIRPTKRMSWLEKQLVKRADSEAFSDLRAVENFYQGLLDLLFKALEERGLTWSDSLSLSVPPLEYGPVDVSDAMWTDSRIVVGTSVTRTSHKTYDPVEPGTSFLEVITAVGKFGGAVIETEDLPITVREIDVSILPTDVLLRPGQDTTFTVTVRNSLHPDSVALLPEYPVQGMADLSIGAATTHTVSYTAPENPIPNSTDLVVVRHMGQGGARGGDAEPRTASATVRFGGIRLLPVTECVGPGQAVQLEVAFTGLDPEPDVVWSTTSGTVDGEGLFTAPGDAGSVTITVALAEDPEIRDSITLSVGGCFCSFTLQVGDGAPYVSQPGDRASYFAPEGVVAGEPAAVGSISFETMEGFGATITVELPTVVINGPGDYPVATINGGLGYGEPEFFASVSPAEGTLLIGEYDPHTTLTGEVIGAKVEDSFNSGGPEYSFSASFQIYPPAGSLGFTYSCLVAAPEGG